MFGQRRVHAASHGNQGHALSFQDGEDGNQLVALSAVRNSQYDVDGFDHAKVAMAGFARMNKHGGRACRGQCGGNLGANVPALAHAGDHHAAFDVEHHLNGLRKARVQTGFESHQGLCLNVQSLACELEGLVWVE